jgi:hypothetical protein
MLTNLKLADLRLTTAQQRSTGQNLPSDIYMSLDKSDDMLPLHHDFHNYGRT